MAASIVHAQSTPAAAGRPPVTRADAESLDRKFEDLSERHRTGRVTRGKSVLVTENELNSYLNLSLGARMPRGLSDVVVRLETERIHATGVLDLEKVRDKMPTLSPWSPLYWLSGQVRCCCAAGSSTTTASPRSSGRTFASATCRADHAACTRSSARRPAAKNTPTASTSGRPFPLPYSVRQVRIEPGRAFLDF